MLLSEFDCEWGRRRLPEPERPECPERPERPERPLRRTGPYGRVFVAKTGLGADSFHFDSVSDCYLSYARAPADWVLDDGSKLPAKKPFTRTSFDPRTRTFRGVVEWPPPATCHGGEQSWEYILIFTDAFDAVEWGLFTVRPSGAVFKLGEWSAEDEALRYTLYTPP